MRYLGLTVVAIGLVFAGATNAQATFFDVVIPSTTCTVGQSVTIPFDVDTPTWGVSLTDFDINYDAAAFKIGEIRYGTGLANYAAQHGGLPANFAIVHTPGVIHVQGALHPTFFAATYGAEFLSIDFEATGNVVGASTISATGWHLYGPTYATMTIEQPAPPPQDPNFLRGDVNYDASCNIMDIASLVQLVFGTAPFAPNCLDTADINDDGSVNVSDAVSLISNLFQVGGPAPEVCGPDSLPDNLPTCTYSACP
ncbi:MAG: dockerin type I domain-containing protein [Planctomycetota bacterium]